jgi:flagellar hook assembly protein FlgD
MIHLDASFVAVGDDVPAARIVLAAAPNPLHSETTLSFTLEREEAGSLRVHDSAGRLVRSLLSGTIAAGPHRIAWDGRNDHGDRVAPGIYFTQLIAGSMREGRKLVVVN